MRQPPPIEPGPEKLSQASQVRALMLQAQGLLLEYTLNGLTYQAQPDHPAWLLINALDALHCGADDRGQFLDPAIHQAVSLTMQWLLAQENADDALQQVNALLQRVITQFSAEQQSRRTQHLAKLGPLAADPSLINTGWCIVKRDAEAIPYEVLGVHAGNWALLNRSATELLEIPAERFLKHIDEGLIEEVGSFDVPYLERIANVSLTASLNAVHAYTWQDPASGCLKRSALMDELERRLAHAVTQPPTFCALIEIPTMRPSLSSLPGDELTVMHKRTGEMLLDALENGEHCGRLSDVSFMMVFVPQEPARLAERLTRLKAEVESLHAEWKMLGAAVPLADNDSAPSPSNVLRRANQACASQRQEAGFDLSCLSVPQSPIERDSGLPFAALYLRCQKIAACVDGAPSHYEILLGVDQEQVPHHTTQSMVVMAEQTGRIQELDLWVLRSSLEWMGRNAPLMDQLSGLSVNLSGASLTVPEHVDVMVEVLSEFPRLLKQLIFEVTETAAIGNLDAAVHSLRKLRRLGCRIALDDFGSGYSSYSYLRSLPLDYLKIDGTYIRNILTDKTDQALTASMVDVAHALGLKVIAEFVDSEGAYSWLKNAGVDYVQGYWVHKPERLDGLSLSEPQLLLT
jgi:EAL domain-containing protein (putative c-di-GMP-specific phosphodiesterase class I)